MCWQCFLTSLLGEKTISEKQTKTILFVCEIFLSIKIFDSLSFFLISFFLLKVVDGIAFRFFIGSVPSPLRGRSPLDS